MAAGDAPVNSSKPGSHLRFLFFLIPNVSTSESVADPVNSTSSLETVPFSPLSGSTHPHHLDDGLQLVFSCVLQSIPRVTGRAGFSKAK